MCAAGGALYAIPWSACTPRVGASREYNVLWGVRVSMQLTAVAWLVRVHSHLLPAGLDVDPEVNRHGAAVHRLVRLYCPNHKRALQ